MNKSVFWSDILSKGAILGGVMLASHIFEQVATIYGKSMTWLSIMGFESIIAAVVFVWLLYRFTKQYAQEVMASQGEVKIFTYGNGLSYAVLVSILAGIIVGVGAYVLHNLIIGHEAYVKGMVEALKDALASAQLPSTMMSSYKQMFAQIAAQPAPTIFSTLLSSVWSYLCWGLISALFIAARTKHEPKLFNNSDNAAE